MRSNRGNSGVGVMGWPWGSGPYYRSFRPCPARQKKDHFVLKTRDFDHWQGKNGRARGAYSSVREQCEDVFNAARGQKIRFQLSRETMYSASQMSGAAASPRGARAFTAS